MPKEQTIEGGAQIRVTQAGFQKLTSIIPGVLNSTLSGGTCVPRGSTGNPTSTFGTGAEWCYKTDGTCAPGCKLNVALNTSSAAVTGAGTLRVNLSTSVNANLPVRGQVIGVGASCTLSVSSNNLGGSFDIALGIKPANGELDVHLAQINSFSLNLNFGGCGLISDIGNLASDIIDSFVGQFLVQLLTPAIDSLLQGILPSPLGIEGLVDVGNLLAGVSPGTDALMETRLVPGGYVRLDSANRGLSLGMITGMNADQDIATRTGLRGDGIPLISEPNLCVPPMSPPLFGEAPHGLGHPLDNPARGTFFLNPAGAFNGNPEPQADLAMGLSETFLDLAGHHLVTSGAMCLGVGTTTIQQLNVGTIGILVPSLAELTSDTGKDPLLLVTRPQKPVDFMIGDNTVASPALTMDIQHLEVDFYAFLYERYVRAFTLDLTMKVGINLEFEQMAGQPAVIRPTLVGLSSDSVAVKVLNSEFVKETPQHLEMVLPSVFDLVTPLLGNLGTFEVPSFAGFSLSNLQIKKVVTPEDDFLALFASLGASTLMRQMAETNPFTQAAVLEMDKTITKPQPQVTSLAHLREVTTPAPEEIRKSMTVGGGKMPKAVFDAPRFDQAGRELEYSYNLQGGLYRPYAAPAADGTFVVQDPAFAWQGKYIVGIKSRVKGDYTTTSVEATTKIIIDSMGPKVLEKKMLWDEDTLRVPMFDIVSEHTLTYAFGKPGADEPSTAWTSGANAELDRAVADTLAVNGELVLFAKDEAGNQTIALIAPFHGQSDGQGCACQTSGGPSTSGIALALFVGIMLFGRRGRAARVVAFARRHRAVANIATIVGVAAISTLLPACDCGDPAAKACELAADCGEDFCPRGQLPFCIDGECLCSEDIIPGRIGAYSDVAATSDGGAWVSGYSINYGDLVVAKVPGAGRVPSEAWEWVDGVPDGPILVPDSAIRGGIDASGEDVGMYTSIAVNPAGEPSVTYFDRDAGSLKFAQKVNGVWQKHVIQAGTGGDLGEFSGELVGMYTSLTLRSDDGRPGVAYLAHVRDTTGDRAEVRYAAAQTPNPTQASDWQLWIVDSAPLAPEDPSAPEVYPLPAGLGLFIDSARLPDQAPVVTYYDRAKGDLKVSKFNPAAGQFGVAVVLDGSTSDAGWSPSIAIDAMGKVNVAYVGPTADDLKFVTEGSAPKVVDDGYRIVGQTVDGLPKPEFHFVGDDASLQIVNGIPYISYQDATTQELLLATRGADGSWTHETIAGATDPWPGAYGFFAASSLAGTTMVISTWVINQPAGNPYEDNWVEVFARQTQVQ